MPSTSKQPTTIPPELADLTDSIRATVRLLKTDNWSDERIARFLGIPEAALTEQYAVELRDGPDIEREHALDLLRKASEALNVSAIKEYIRITGAAGTVEEYLANKAPERKARVLPKGAKEVAHEAALHAHEAGEWGEDLAPLPSRAVN